MDYLKGLNKEQEKAVLHKEGPLLILAGAGSGKTKVLTHRIAYLIEEENVFPGSILAITFTNKAATEMKERVAELLDGDIESIWMGTFHSICVRILRRDIDKIGFQRSFTIYDRDDQITLVKECLSELKLDRDMYKERVVLSIISSLKDAGEDPDLYINENYNDFYQRNIGEIYSLYEKKLKENNALDFDDLIIRTVELLNEDKKVLDYYQEKFKHIFVDEYQDTNKAQYRLIRLLSGKYENLCVVGDDDQSIYKFRGADISNILGFEKDFPDTEIIKLEQNYRSTQSILDVANNVIKNNRERKAKRLWTANKGGDQVVVENVIDQDEEAYFVANKMEELLREGYKASDFAILYRTNAQSRSFEEVFMRKNLPYKLVGGLRFYDRKEIKDIVAYLNIIQNPVDDISLKRIINVPKRGIGKVTMDRIEEYASRTGESLYSALLSIEEIPKISKRATNNLRKFTEMINKCFAMNEVMGVKEFIETVIYDTGYMEALEADESIESQTRIDNIKEFISVAVDFEMETVDGTLEDFLADVSLLSDVDKTEDTDRAVTMLTVHSSKGLEFPVVFMVGMEEGLFPMGRALDDESELEEERRLCYVAMTRAEELLYITHAKLRTIYGKTNYTRLSRFINEVPESLRTSVSESEKSRDLSKEKPRSSKGKLIEFKNYKKPLRDESRGKIGSKARRERVNQKPAIDESRVKEGLKVTHGKWGTGTIVQIKDRPDDKEITIAFEGVGLKRLLLSIAPIEILKGD